MSTSLLETPPTASRPAHATPPTGATGFFEQASPVTLILWTFPLVTIPVAVLSVLQSQTALVWLYLWLFGMTHFVLTLTVYLQSANLRHFASSRRNQVVFFVVPVLILFGFDVLHAVRFGAVFPTAALVMWGVIRFFDFVHFNRQSFGVLQLFKGRTKTKPNGGLKRLENAFFFSLVANLYISFLAGGASPLVRSWITPPIPVRLPEDVLLALAFGGALLSASLLLAVLIGHRRTYAGKPGANAALAYLLLQTASAVMATVYFPLYAAALALHYVEYHVLMHPRVFALPLDERYRLDRGFRYLRTRPLLFYAALITVAFLVTGGAYVGMGMMGAELATLDQPTGVLIALAVFDGLFVFHYFVEMFIWKFSDPHFRQALGGLYFTKK